MIADRLAHEMVRDGPAGQAVAVQGGPQVAAVVVLGERPVDFEVIAPAGELETFVAPGRRLLGDNLERKISPLAGEQRDRPAHLSVPAAWRVIMAPLLGLLGRWRSSFGSLRSGSRRRAPPGWPARPGRRAAAAGARRWPPENPRIRGRSCVPIPERARAATTATDKESRDRSR